MPEAFTFRNADALSDASRALPPACFGSDGALAGPLPGQLAVDSRHRQAGRRGLRSLHGGAMKIPHQLLVKLSPLVEAARGEPLVEPFLEIRQNSEERLVLASSYGTFVFDKEHSQVLLEDGASIPFSAIRSVDVSAFPGGLGERSWSISLYQGLIERTTVARTYDDGEASVVAAKLARAIGCKVVALFGTR